MFYDSDAPVQVFRSELCLEMGLDKLTGIEIGQEEIETLEAGVFEQRTEETRSRNLSSNDDVSLYWFYKGRKCPENSHKHTLYQIVGFCHNWTACSLASGRAGGPFAEQMDNAPLGLAQELLGILLLAPRMGAMALRSSKRGA